MTTTDPYCLDHGTDMDSKGPCRMTASRTWKLNFKWPWLKLGTENGTLEKRQKPTPRTKTSALCTALLHLDRAPSCGFLKSSFHRIFLGLPGSMFPPATKRKNQLPPTSKRSSRSTGPGPMAVILLRPVQLRSALLLEDLIFKGLRPCQNNSHRGRRTNCVRGFGDLSTRI